MKRLLTLLAVASTLLGATAFAQDRADAPDLAATCPSDTFLYLGIEDWPGLLETCEETPLQGLIEKGTFAEMMGSVLPDMMLPGYLSSGKDDLEEEEIELSKERFSTFMNAINGPIALTVSDPIPMVEWMMENMNDDFGAGLIPGPDDLPDDLLDPEAAPDAEDLQEFMLGEKTEEQKEMEKLVTISIFVGDARKDMHKLFTDFAEDPGEHNLEGKVLEKRDGGITYFVSEQTHKDTTIEDMHWAFVDGTLVVAMSKDALLTRARAIKKPPAKSLADAEGFARVLAEADDESDGVLYVNLEGLGAYANEQIKDLDMEDAGAPMAMDPKQIAKALQLDTTEAFHMTFTVQEEGVRMNSGYAFSKETKLQKLLMPYLEKAPLRPDFIPNDVSSVSSFRMSMIKWHDDFLALLSDMNPQIGMMMGMGAMMMKQEMGIDYKKDLLGNLGDSIIYSQTMDMEEMADLDEINPLAGQNMIFGIGTKDEVALHGAIKTMLAAVGGGEDGVIEEEKFLGVTMYKLSPAADADMDVSYAFIDDHMVLGIGEDSLKSAIRTHKNPRKSVWKIEEMDELLAELPPDALSVEYSRLGSLFGQMSMLTDQLGDAGLDAELGFDIEELEGVFGNILSASYKEGPRLVTKSIMHWADK